MAVPVKVCRRPINRENNNSRASFHGGTGGTQVRPQGSDAAAWREPTASRMSTQVQHEQKFQSNRGQFANTNHGQPAKPAISRPLRADRNVKPTTRVKVTAGTSKSILDKAAPLARTPIGHFPI